MLGVSGQRVPRRVYKKEHKIFLFSTLASELGYFDNVLARRNFLLAAESVTSAKG